MVKEYQYINIREVLSRLLRHPLLQDLTLEQAVQYTVDFIYIVGMPKMYQDKEVVIDIEDYRGLLPCDLISIIQCEDCKTERCMRAMTSTFENDERDRVELSFKTQGRVIYTSFKKGAVKIAYKAIPVDDEGYPMLIDNAVFLGALEAYIKKQAFTVLFDTDKIKINVLQNAQQEYAWKVGQCQSEFTMPSISEMEAISRMWTSLIQKTTEFDKGFRHLGDREYIRRH